MIRFCRKEDITQKDCQAALSRKPLCFHENIWKKVKEAFLFTSYDDCEDYLIPMTDDSGEIICFAYQDSEANRELRMLEELRENENALQFTDIFPDYKEALICGCNELAACLADYLNCAGITVSVTGDYWDLLGYKSAHKTNGRKTLVVYAEGAVCYDMDLSERRKRSVSPEFECVNKIYETNVLQNRIHNTIGNKEMFFDILRKEQEILILGVDRTAQDAYDLLMAHGIDILGFAAEEKHPQELLGKSVLSIPDAMRQLQKPVFINCKDCYGALGEKLTEYFNYQGYKRNQQYFLLKDYFKEIPQSNLIHVLRQKKVLLIGDTVLCNQLSDYLYRVENGCIDVSIIEMDQRLSVNQGEIRCLVIPEYYNTLQYVAEEKYQKLQKQLSKMGIQDYTDYFSSNRAYMLMELYRNQNIEKYTLSALTPKGICLGRIPGWSGNVFVRGVLDGHPELLVNPESDLNNNLLFYCICLANIDANKVLDNFWKIYQREACNKEEEFPNPERFNNSVRRFLKLKKRFTSQELFVLFHIAYAEMLREQQISDISNLVIYWEPHLIPRNTFAFFALWLEDEKVNGQTLVLRRNNIVRAGSGLARAKRGWESVYDPYPILFLDDFIWDSFPLQYQHWKEFKMRFEDMKLHPREKLMELCGHLGIAWSDSMQKTTRTMKGRHIPLAHCGSVDFDLKAVFDKYEDFLSEFDRFRISITSSMYQKKYGYPYENCLKFTRRELQELFLKPFLFEDESVFEKGELAEKSCGWLTWQLWNVRKHMLLDDIIPEFGKIEIKQTAAERMAQHYEKEIYQAIEYVKTHEKIIIYGTGGDCRELLKLMDGSTKARILYSDKRAGIKSYMFEGKEVIPPQELCTTYKDYYILSASGLFWKEIEKDFHDMGIQESRVFYNKAEIGEN